jgi:hypothetical protein
MAPQIKREPLIRFLVINAALGALVGVIFAVAMLLTDTLGVFTLLRNDSTPVLTTFIFLAGCICTFSTLVIATATGFVGPSN